MIEHLIPEDLESFREKACYKVNNGKIIHTKTCKCKDKLSEDDYRVNDPCELCDATRCDECEFGGDDDPCDACDRDIDCADCEYGGNG